jgi:CDP-diacylglycerol--glycerol-3-phosphate 3-phosphatidyltransferase
MTTANYITLSRVLFVPLIVLLMPFNPYIVFVLYIVACLTDMLDGWVARHFNQVSDLGKVFDQIIDKVLIVSMLAGIIFKQNIYGYGWMYFITLLIIVFREFVVSGLRMVAGNSGRIIPANIFGKIKTTSQMILIGFPLWNEMNIYFIIPDWIIITAMVFVWFTTLYSGYKYYEAIMVPKKTGDSE